MLGRLVRHLTPEQLARILKKMAGRLEDGAVVDEAAADCSMSMSDFVKSFTLAVGASPHQWLLERRMERAMDLLRGGRLTIPEIALSCGFADETHFRRVFLRITGLSPEDWQKIRLQ